MHKDSLISRLIQRLPFSLSCEKENEAGDTLSLYLNLSGDNNQIASASFKINFPHSLSFIGSSGQGTINSNNSIALVKILNDTLTP